MKYEVKLNPEPTPVQFAQFRRHRAAGTSPGNPKWYKPPTIKPFKFVGGVRLPRIESGAEYHTAHEMKMPDPFKVVSGKDDGAYINAFLTAKGLMK